MLKVEASDLYLTAGSPPVFRIDGAGYPAKHALTPEQTQAMVHSLRGAEQRVHHRLRLLGRECVLGRIPRAVDPEHGRAAGGEVEVRGLDLEHVLEQAAQH